MKYPAMFQQMTIGKTIIKNRVVMGAMGHGQAADQCEFSKSTEDFYAARARGGVGLILTGITEPDFEIDKFPNDGICGYVNPNYNPKVFIERGTELTERIHNYGAKVFLQITAGFGRALHNVSCSENPLWGDPTQKAHEITKQEIKRKVELVASAALIGKNAGFDGVDLSAFHEGCLMDEFATPFFNKRTDEYGGSFENRMRFTKELVEAVKNACGQDYPITIRLSVRGFFKGFNQASLDGEGEVGRTIEDSIEVAKYLQKVGVDALLIDVGVFDSMYHTYQPMYIEKGSNFKYTEILKKEVKIPVICTGRMHDPKVIEEGLAAGKADGVCMARSLLADADFVMKAKLGHDEKIRPCLSCNVGCLHRVLSGQRYSCAVNPLVNRETTYGLSPALIKRKILVVGGGVAGMEAARVSKLRGHDVTLWEKSECMGGHLISGGAPSFKEDERVLISWYKQELKELNVTVELNKSATVDAIREFGADIVINATGSQAIIPEFVVGKDKAITGVDALLNKKPVGENVVIVGGGLVGSELALHLESLGKKVTIVEMLPEILSSGKTVPLMNKMLLSDIIAASKIDVKTNCKLLSVEDGCAKVELNGEETKISADTVIIAAGFKSSDELFKELEGEIEIYNIGDSKNVANIKNAVWDAYEVARSI